MDNNLLDTLRLLTDNPAAPVDSQWSDAMAAAYPYFPLPAVMELQRDPALTPQRRKLLLRRAAMTLACPEVLHTMADPETLDPHGFYPAEPEPPKMTTEQVIDTFISRYGPSGASKEEAVLEKLIFNPTPDYSKVLEDEAERLLPSEDEASGDGQDALISAFILKSRRNRGQSSFPSPSDPITPGHPAPQPAVTDTPPVATPAERPDDTLLSESLAKIFIKRGQYQRAHEIISTLYLKYPQKSVYFADQLRFLQKLIINQQFQNTKTTK